MQPKETELILCMCACVCGSGQMVRIFLIEFHPYRTISRSLCRGQKGGGARGGRRVERGVERGRCGEGTGWREKKKFVIDALYVIISQTRQLLPMRPKSV